MYRSDIYRIVKKQKYNFHVRKKVQIKKLRRICNHRSFFICTLHYLFSIKFPLTLPTAKVNRSYFEKAEVSAQEAWGLAEKNTNKESFVMGLAEYMARRFGKCMETMLFLDQTPFYVVTNKSGHKGASAILNKKMLSEFGKKYNINKVVVIPSSIHEMFILSADILESVGMKELTKMVQYVNKNEVSDKEQLSDRAYILDI